MCCIISCSVALGFSALYLNALEAPEIKAIFVLYFSSVIFLSGERC